MRVILILLIVFVGALTGCGAVLNVQVAPDHHIKGPSDLKEGYGAVVVRLDSSWLHKEIGPWGYPVYLLYRDLDHHFNYGKISLTNDRELTLIPLREGQYEWYVTATDQSAHLDYELPFTIKRGEVTNLGRFFIDMDWPSMYGPRVYVIRQSNFEDVRSELHTKLRVDGMPVNKQCVFGKDVRLGMWNSIGKRYLTNYLCER